MSHLWGKRHNTADLQHSRPCTKVYGGPEEVFWGVLTSKAGAVEMLGKLEDLVAL